MKLVVGETIVECQNNEPKADQNIIDKNGRPKSIDLKQLTDRLTISQIQQSIQKEMWDESIGDLLIRIVKNRLSKLEIDTVFI